MFILTRGAIQKNFLVLLAFDEMTYNTITTLTYRTSPALVLQFLVLLVTIGKMIEHQTRLECL